MYLEMGAWISFKDFKEGQGFWLFALTFFSSRKIMLFGKIESGKIIEG